MTKTAKRKKSSKPAQPAEIIAIKGFDKDFKCRGFQYEVGKTYRHEGEIAICQSGFHACEEIADVFKYYPLLISRYAEVGLSGDLKRDGKDSKIAAATITIKAELKLPELVKQFANWIVSKAKNNLTTGDRSHAASTGNYSHAASAGNSSHAASTGNCSHAASTGHSSHAASTGDRSHAASTGDCSHAASTGYSSHAASTGYSSHAASTGHYSHAASTGDRSHAASTGHSSHAASTGDRSHAASTGNSSHAASTGDRSHAASTGYSSHAASTGYSSHAASTGDCGVAFAGFGGRAKASATGAIAIAYYDEKEKRAKIASANVGENGIEADTWYCVVDGKIVAAEGGKGRGV